MVIFKFRKILQVQYYGNTFTFQYGDIQIQCKVEHIQLKEIYIPIWWYSNGKTFFNQIEIEKNLHSNLVIFKFVSLCYLTFYLVNLHSNLVIFKFRLHDIPYLAKSEFTFQSGDIQIYWRCLKQTFCLLIYIPIWWYSNFSTNFILAAIAYIYIPIWWYSNVDGYVIV